jgi:hypothetical protein
MADMTRGQDINAILSCCTKSFPNPPVTVDWVRSTVRAQPFIHFLNLPSTYINFQYDLQWMRSGCMGPGCVWRFGPLFTALNDPILTIDPGGTMLQRVVIFCAVYGRGNTGFEKKLMYASPHSNWLRCFDTRRLPFIKHLFLSSVSFNTM